MHRIIFTAFASLLILGCGTQPNSNPLAIKNLLLENTVMIIVSDDGKVAGTGSGFLVEHKGQNYIITNFHVIGDSGEDDIVIARKNRDGGYIRYSNIKVAGVIEDNDLAVLTVEGMEKWGKGLVVQPDRTLLEPVIIAGFPKGLLDEKDITLTTGTISNPEVSIENKKRIKLNIAANPGNSGGPVVNGRGEVIGVVYLKLTDIIESVAYALPVLQAIDLIDHIEDFKDKDKVQSIIKVKMEKFLRLAQFNQEIPKEYFIQSYWKKIKTSFVLVHDICAAIWRENDENEINLPVCPSPEGKENISLLGEYLNTHDLWDEIYGDGSEAKVLTLILAYNQVCQYREIKQRFKQPVEKEITTEQLDQIITYFVNRLSDGINNYRLNSEDIDNFEVVSIDPSLNDESQACRAKVWVTVEYFDELRNFLFYLSYSRGCWRISDFSDTGSR